MKTFFIDFIMIFFDAPLFLRPKIIYSLKSAPLWKIQKSFLLDADKLIRFFFVKNMSCLPADTFTSLCYIHLENIEVYALVCAFGGFRSKKKVCMSFKT